MANTLEEILGSKLVKGIISVPTGSQKSFSDANEDDLVIGSHSKIEVYEGASHNHPDEDSLKASKKIVELVETLNEKDILFVLISGGGSALLPYPTPPITLNEKSRLIHDLSLAGANIRELNSVRKKISELKGGKLALLAKKPQIISLILSDIIGDPLDLISSSPTVKNSDPQDQALNVLKKYGQNIEIPKSILEVVSSNHDDVSEDSFQHVHNILIGNIDKALEGLSNACVSKGYNVIIGSDSIEGEARYVGKYFAQLAYFMCENISEKSLNIFSEHFENRFTSKKSEFEKYFNDLKINQRPFALIFGGETIVKVTGTGIGGRNQEMALAFSIELDELNKQNTEYRDNYDIYFLSAGTDGIDGPNDAAGAIGYNNLVLDALSQELDPKEALNNNDSYNFFKKLNNGQQHLKVGHTGTNVMDIHLILVLKK